ncbi:MAG TPA: outer membrane lipoprotein chaperone LolA [Solimonas sp.]|nr:outer membrane lipoprotein chaperone LolA [Solimonas sp.]
MKLRAVLLALALLSAPAAQAEDPQATLKRFVDGVQTLSADFAQLQTDEDGKLTGSSSGTMALSRPGRFRWTYEKPYSQLMVCDGRKIWLYDPDLAQVTVRSAEQALSGTPAALLSQKALLSDAFTLKDGGREGGAQIVKLLPKSQDGDFKSIELWLAAGVPQRMRFHDQLGGSTDIRFSAIKSNLRLDDTQFRFTPPKGVEVVEGGG